MKIFETLLRKLFLKSTPYFDVNHKNQILFTIPIKMVFDRNFVVHKVFIKNYYDGLSYKQYNIKRFKEVGVKFDKNINTYFFIYKLTPIDIFFIKMYKEIDLDILIVNNRTVDPILIKYNLTDILNNDNSFFDKVKKIN